MNKLIHSSKASVWTRVLAATVVVVGAWGASVAGSDAHARGGNQQGKDLYFSIGVTGPGVAIGASNMPPAVVYPAPQVVYPAPAVVYPAAPVYYQPPRVVYQQPPRVVRAHPPRRHGHHHGWSRGHGHRHEHGYRRGHDRWDDGHRGGHRHHR